MHWEIQEGSLLINSATDLESTLQAAVESLYGLVGARNIHFQVTDFGSWAAKIAVDIK